MNAFEKDVLKYKSLYKCFERIKLVVYSGHNWNLILYSVFYFYFLCMSGYPFEDGGSSHPQYLFLIIYFDGFCL